MDFLENLSRKAEKCSQLLFKYFEMDDNSGSNIFDAYLYSIKLPGKRLRMIILLEAAKLFSDNVDDCVPFACALEMIHTYSLIHDDLPAMDDALYRRGQLTNHKQFDEATAILAGDGLLTYSFEIMTEAALIKSEKALDYMRAINEIGKAAGVNGMVLGQAMDTQLTQKDIKLLQKIYDKKTAALFIGAMKAGAIIAGANDIEVDAIATYAYHFGIAFQIADDILDVTGDSAITGKLAGNDSSNEKITMASLLGVTDARNEALRHASEAKAAIESYDKYGFFRDLCDFAINRNS